MGTTPALALPYPEPSDLLRNDAAATRALAERLAAILDPAPAAQIERATSGVALPASTPTTVTFPGAQTLMQDFTYAGGVLTYTGPSRLFLISVEVEVQQGHAGGNEYASTVEVFHAGASIAGSHDQIGTSTSDLVSRRRVHRLTVPGILGSGQTIHVNATASGGTTQTLGTTGLRVYPVGPVRA